LGVFGVDLVKELKDLNAVVLAVDKDTNKVALVGDIADRTFICDSTNIAALEEIGLDKVETAIVAMGQGNPTSAVASITTTLALKKLGVEDIIVRLDDMNYKNVLEEIGATTLFSPLKMASGKLANLVLSDKYEDYFNINDEYSVLEIEVKENVLL
jgi:trk system potassium uptake protein TrkA